MQRAKSPESDLDVLSDEMDEMRRVAYAVPFNSTKDKLSITR